MTTARRGALLAQLRAYISIIIVAFKIAGGKPPRIPSLGVAKGVVIRPSIGVFRERGREMSSSPVVEYVLYKAPIQLETLCVVQYLYALGIDLRPTSVVERNHSVRATALRFKDEHPDFRIART